jgi:hypothetical protein
MFSNMPMLPPPITREMRINAFAEDIFMKLLLRKDTKPEDAIDKAFELATAYYEVWDKHRGEEK